ncbi:hypothetical protein K4H28_10955 [Deefgea tanakiae]|uniref:Uncharacterized protein n=1 Tax=Deefgea tanakiae TaxID=2865840 RepID=A0ABX8Z2M6_9NEIS|nr:hypothetical protein [Deefgea tanakiae]QZA76833.1 hypothetical protein K4H28_10955 [Deefgea tanakiae]
MNKMIKTGLLAGAALVALSGQVLATDACTGTGGDATISAGSFIVNGFTLKCSKNVVLGYTESTNTKVGVCAASQKGNRKFGGTSEGGAVADLGAHTQGTATTITSGAGNGCS